MYEQKLFTDAEPHDFDQDELVALNLIDCCIKC